MLEEWAEENDIEYETEVEVEGLEHEGLVRFHTESDIYQIDVYNDLDNNGTHHTSIVRVEIDMGGLKMVSKTNVKDLEVQDDEIYIRGPHSKTSPTKITPKELSG